MKKLFTLLLLLTYSGFSFAQTTIDFETVGQDWSWTVFANVDDDPALYSVAANPDNTGINASANAAKFIINDAANPWAGVWSGDIEDFTFDATNSIVKIMVYKDVISNFALKFEGDAGQVELKVANTVINEWEELTFDFSAQIGVMYKVITIMPDFADPRTVGSTNYFDNISFEAVPPSVPTIDFETLGQDWTWNVFANVDDDPALFSVVTNPDNTGINTSADVAKYVVNDAANPWAGVWSADIADFTFDATNSTVKIMVYKDVISNFALKFEGDAGQVELKVANTVINEWEELTFDLSAQIGITYKVINIMPDFSDPRTVGSTNYFDNISFHDALVAPPVAGVTIDFETVGQDWSWNVFANVDDDPALFSIVANPDNTGINTSADVAKYIVNDAANPWAGAWSGDIIDFTFDETNCIVKVMVYKDVISNFALKFEGDAGQIELKVANTVTNEWEELTFDYSAQIGITYKVISIMPDFSDPRTVGSTNYFDNISFNEVVPVLSTIDFETVGQDWSWTLFSNGDNDTALYSVVANPENTGINTSDNVAKYIVNATGADPWAGVWSGDIVDFTFDETNSNVKIMVYKDVISNFGLKFEGDEGQIEFKVANTKINEWEELTFDYSAQIGKTYKVITIMPDFSDPRTTGSTNYWDNISFNEVEGTPLFAPSLPIDFEQPDVYVYTWSDFGGSVATVVSNPDASGINTSATVVEINKTAGAETWAGSFMNLAGAIDFSESTIVNVKVYSPRVGVPILFKLENSANTSVFAEVSVSTTVADTWEVLAFDLSTYGAFSATNTYDRVILFADFESWGEGESFYFDDIELEAAVIGFDELNQIDFKVYPNPASDYLYISNISDLKRVHIYSITGQKVKTFEFLDNKIQIDELPQGMYLLSAESHSGEVFSTKFFKN